RAGHDRLPARVRHGVAPLGPAGATTAPTLLCALVTSLLLDSPTPENTGAILVQSARALPQAVRETPSSCTRQANAGIAAEQVRHARSREDQGAGTSPLLVR